MGSPVGLVVLAVTTLGGLLLAGWWRQARGELVKDRARLRVVEGQLATMRAVLRIQAAEHLVRQRMLTELRQTDPFTNRTNHEEPEEWR